MVPGVIFLTLVAIFGQPLLDPMLLATLGTRAWTTATRTTIVRLILMTLVVLGSSGNIW